MKIETVDDDESLSLLSFECSIPFLLLEWNKGVHVDINVGLVLKKGHNKKKNNTFWKLVGIYIKIAWMNMGCCAFVLFSSYKNPWSKICLIIFSTTIHKCANITSDWLSILYSPISLQSKPWLNIYQHKTILSKPSFDSLQLLPSFKCLR